MTFALNPRSEKNLVGVHADLVRVVRRAAETCPDDISFVVTEGVRAKNRQAELLAAGASTTMKSRHLTGHAVDMAVVVGKEVRWDFPLYARLGVLMKAAAAELGVAMEWGGDWVRLRDGPHFQLNWKAYP